MVKKSIHNHFTLPMSLFIDLTFRHPNREASSEQFLAVLPLMTSNVKSINKLIGSTKWL